MPQFADFDPIDVGQDQPGITWDFGAWLPAGVFLVANGAVPPTLTVTTEPGSTDPTPNAIKTAGPSITTVPFKPANTALTVDLHGNVPATYLLQVKCSRSDGGIATGDNHITVRAPS